MLRKVTWPIRRTECFRPLTLSKTTSFKAYKIFSIWTKLYSFKSRRQDWRSTSNLYYALLGEEWMSSSMITWGKILTDTYLCSRTLLDLSDRFSFCLKVWLSQYWCGLREACNIFGGIFGFGAMTAIDCKIDKIMLIVFTTGVSEIIPGVFRHSFLVIFTLHILDFWFLNAQTFCLVSGISRC